jgi:hypothetical protein
MLEKLEKLGSREILSDGHIQCRWDTEIWEDGHLLSTSYWREVIAPGQDVSGHAPEIQRIARVEHTPAVVKAYIDRTRPTVQPD